MYAKVGRRWMLFLGVQRTHHEEIFAYPDHVFMERYLTQLEISHATLSKIISQNEITPRE
jgi:hypothetical protein